MMADVASAMKHLVDLGFVHRDLAAKNIQINAQLKCKLADMSMARKIADTQFPHQVKTIKVTFSSRNFDQIQTRRHNPAHSEQCYCLKLTHELVLLILFVERI